MSETWPATIDQNILQDGFRQQAKDIVIRTTMEAGLDKLRRRYTTAIINITPQMILDYTQQATLEDFYNITLQGGVLTFNFDDPVSGTTKEYRFLSPPIYTPYGGLYFIVTMEWECVG